MSKGVFTVLCFCKHGVHHNQFLLHEKINPEKLTGSKSLGDGFGFLQSFRVKLQVMNRQTPKHIPSLKLTANAKETIIFQPSIFRGELALSFREGTSFSPQIIVVLFFFLPQLAVFECRLHAVEGTPIPRHPPAIPQSYLVFGGLSLEPLKHLNIKRCLGVHTNNPHHVFGRVVWVGV